MKKMLESLREASRQAIEEAVDMDSLEALRVRYLGKKGELTAILKQMGKLSAEERPVIGQLANEVRSELENEIESRKSALAARLQEAKLRAETLQRDRQHNGKRQHGPADALRSAVRDFPDHLQKEVDRSGPAP